MEAEGLDDDSNKAPGPAVKEDVGKAEFDEKELGKWEHKDFRSRGATLNYVHKIEVTYSTRSRESAKGCRSQRREERQR